MKEEPLHPWIEPELEARIVALVLGEASDFEREELDHLIEERSELAMLKKRFETVHGLLQEIATGESAEDNDGWKLSDEKRQAVLAVIDGEGRGKATESVLTKTVTKPKARRGSFLRTFTQIAAALFVMALIAGMMMPAYQRVLEPSGHMAAAKSEAAYFADTASSSYNPPTADAASVARPNHQAKSQSSLSAIQKSLGQYAVVASNEEKGDQLSKSLVVGYNSAYVFKEARDKNSLSFPDMDESHSDPYDLSTREAAFNSAFADAGLTASTSSGGAMGVVVAADGFADSAPFSSSGGGGAAADPFAPAGDGAEMASADPFAGSVRDDAAMVTKSPFEKNGPVALKLEEGNASSLLRKSSSFVVPVAGANKPQAPGEVSDKKIHMGHGQVTPIVIANQLSDSEAEQDAVIAGRIISSELAENERGRVAGKKEASKARELSEGKSVSPRGQISTRGKMAKTKAKQDSDAFAANAPAKSAPAPAAAPMPAIKGELAEQDANTGPLYANADRNQGAITGYSSTAHNHTRAEFLRQVAAGWELPVPTKIRGGVDISGNQKTQDRVTRRKLVESDSPQAANEEISMEVTDKKMVMNKESRENYLRQAKKRAELQAAKQLNGRPLTMGNRSGQYAVTAEAIDSLLEDEKMSRDAKGNKAAALADEKLFTRNSKTSYLTLAPQALLERQIKSVAFKILPIKKSAPPTGLNEKNAQDEAFSTFSLHVSDVSFKLAQAALAKGEWPDASKIRIEEFVNAFDYGDPMPNQNEKVASQMEQGIHPFLQQRNLLRVSMRTAAAGRSSQTPLRLTFLLDNSGSMERSDRQQTVQRAFALLVQQLQPMDQVTLISFARQPRLLADKVSGSKAQQLVQLVANIPSEGGTNLEAALQLAFEKAKEQQLDKAQNRIIMLTDGAANLGDADPERLSWMIENMRDAGIAFDAAGIGADGLNDEILEALTRKGDGRYYLLDQPEDADEGFARQIAGALRPAAKNVKVQIEFNPKRVGHYKLLGFEKHRLKKEDFRNDKVDAAEMAAAEAGVAIYQFEAKPDGEGDVGSVSVRFRDMSSGQMVENRWPIPYIADAPRIDQAAPSLRVASTAALFAAKLKGEPLGDSVDLQMLSNLISGLPERQRHTKRVQQLQQMINQARQVSGQ